MSSEEKRTWISALVGVVVPVAYLAIVLSKVPGTDVARIPYVWPMLTSIGVGIVAGIVLAIVAAMASPKDADRTDERDREINQRGEYVGFYVMSIAAIVPLVLAMAKVEHFWIAHALYLAFVLAALTSSVVKIVAYRRGW
jgi:predicted lysophospholipase L1 biosynthesis ABC-type transport system permease subunit